MLQPTLHGSFLHTKPQQLGKIYAERVWRSYPLIGYLHFRCKVYLVDCVLHNWYNLEHLREWVNVAVIWLRKEFQPLMKWTSEFWYPLLCTEIIHETTSSKIEKKKKLVIITLKKCLCGKVDFEILWSALILTCLWTTSVIEIPVTWVSPTEYLSANWFVKHY